MSRRISFSLAILVFIQFILGIVLSTPTLAQEWKFRRPRGTLRVMDLFLPSASVAVNYARSLVGIDKDNNWLPGLAEDWKWIDDRTIEFKLRQGVTFHNGEKFNTEAVRVNWEEYRRMESPLPWAISELPDESPKTLKP
jgi:ABC-type transport system substrate-binding protein